MNRSSPSAFESAELADALAAGLSAMDLGVDAAARSRLLQFLALLQRWNRTYNLTAIRQPHDMLVQHVFDTLAPLPILRKSALAGRQYRIADVGSGAGLPGIPWAIIEPEWRVTLIEAVEKKSAFQRQAAIELGVPNLVVFAGRVENAPSAQFDLVVSRAFSSLDDFAALAGHLVADGGRLCALKGQSPAIEIKALQPPWVLDEIFPLTVPQLAAQRHLVFMRKA